MFRFTAILVWCFASSALASSTWNEALQDLKDTAATGNRALVAEKLKSAYETFDGNEKIRSQVLTWGAELLEIFNTQKGLNDFERAKSLSDLEPELALELLQRSLEAEPNHPRVLAQIVDIHLRRREIGKAKALAQKLVADYPLWENSYLYQLRALTADHGVRGLEEVTAKKDLPFPNVKALAVLLVAAHKIMDGSEEQEILREQLDPALEKFSEWPEVTYLAIELDGPERQKWVSKFLGQCAGDSGAALPKYPSAICQRVGQVEELVDVKPEAL